MNGSVSGSLYATEGLQTAKRNFVLSNLNSQNQSSSKTQKYNHMMLYKFKCSIHDTTDIWMFNT